MAVIEQLDAMVALLGDLPERLATVLGNIDQSRETPAIRDVSVSASAPTPLPTAKEPASPATTDPVAVPVTPTPAVSLPAAFPSPIRDVPPSLAIPLPAVREVPSSVTTPLPSVRVPAETELAPLPTVRQPADTQSSEPAAPPALADRTDRPVRDTSPPIPVAPAAPAPLPIASVREVEGRNQAQPVGGPAPDRPGSGGGLAKVVQLLEKILKALEGTVQSVGAGRGPGASPLSRRQNTVSFDMGRVKDIDAEEGFPAASPSVNVSSLGGLRGAGGYGMGSRYSNRSSLLSSGRYQRPSRAQSDSFLEPGGRG